jgi:hypothetical protein
MTTAAAPIVRRNRAAVAGLSLAGCAMFGLAAAAPWIVRTFDYGVFIPLLAVSGALTIAATRLAADVPERVGLIVVLGFALAMRLVLVGPEPLMSTDIYRYIWDGRVQDAGINPYIYVPADPALAALRDAAIYPKINRADYAVTAYPPLAEMFFFAVTRVSESLVAMRLAMVACEAIIVAVLIALLRRLGRPETEVVAYAWHPLAVFEIANNGHVEALMVALLMAGLWLLIMARRTVGAFLVGLAAVAKPYAVFVLPAYWRPWDWRVPLAVAAAIALCYLPYLGAGKGVLGFLGGGYLSEEGLTSGEGIWLVALAQRLLGSQPALVPIYGLAAAAIMIVLGLRISFRRDGAPQQVIADVMLLLTAGLFLLSPNYAWYFLALVPFLALGAGAPIWALTLGAFLLYRPFLLPDNDLLWKSLSTLPFLVALVVERFRITPGEP